MHCFLCFETDGISNVVGTYFPDTDKIVFDGARILWQGKSCSVNVLLIKVVCRRSAGD